MELEHFVTYISQGVINCNEVTQQVRSNELRDLVIPEGTIAFKLFDRANEDMFKNGKLIVYKNELLNENTYYIGKVISLDEVKAEFGEESTAYKNLIKNNYIGAVRTKDNFLLPLEINQKIHILAPEQVGLQISVSDYGLDLENE